MNTVNLSKIGFFRPVIGKTLREQLQGKKPIDRDTFEQICTLLEIKSFEIKGCTLPIHWRFKFPYDTGNVFCIAQAGSNDGMFFIEGFRITRSRPYYHGKCLSYFSSTPIEDQLVFDKPGQPGTWSRYDQIIVTLE